MVTKKAESHSECKLHLYKLFSPPCISPVCHTLPKRGWCAIQSKCFIILGPFSKSEKRQELLEVLTDLHIPPAKNYFQINQLFSTFRIEARKAWLASVSTVFHYTTLYWPDLNFTFKLCSERGTISNFWPKETKMRIRSCDMYIRCVYFYQILQKTANGHCNMSLEQKLPTQLGISRPAFKFSLSGSTMEGKEGRWRLKKRNRIWKTYQKMTFSIVLQRCHILIFKREINYITTTTLAIDSTVGSIVSFKRSQCLVNW